VAVRLCQIPTTLFLGCRRVRQERDSSRVRVYKYLYGGPLTVLVPRFRLKFRGIVKEEQKANFISRLHRGKLDIIPWPVIESSEFYKLLSALKKRLDQQPISHPVAGEFLHTIKTLMAKLKASSLSSP
jgi:hypothetical protein